MTDLQPLWELFPLIVSLGGCLLVMWWAFSRGDPVSQFARANFKMKLDKKTGMFWAKPKGGIQPPCCCSECIRVGCSGGRSKPGFVLVNCPKLETQLSQNGGICEEPRGERP